MKTIFILLFICSASLANAQTIENQTSTENTNEKNSVVDQVKKETRRKGTDTLKMIFERIDAVHQLISKQEEKIASDYKLPMEELKKQHLTDDSLLFSKSTEIRKLNETISGLNSQLKMKDEQLSKLTNDVTSVKNETLSKQALIDQLAQQINLQIGLLKNASYSTDPLWIDQLMNTCNQFTDKSKILNYNWLIEFKSKSSAISQVMYKIQTVRFLKKSDLEKLKLELEKGYAIENPNFYQLKSDYLLCSKLLSDYTDAFCEVLDNIDIVLGMKTYQLKQREEILVQKSYKMVLE
jgi:type I site-specific restriction endonuclease